MFKPQYNHEPKASGFTVTFWTFMASWSIQPYEVRPWKNVVKNVFFTITKIYG